MGSKLEAVGDVIELGVIVKEVGEGYRGDFG